MITKSEKFLFVVNICIGQKTNVNFQVNVQYKIVKLEGELFTLENIITGEEQG